MLSFYCSAHSAHPIYDIEVEDSAHHRSQCEGPRENITNDTGRYSLASFSGRALTGARIKYNLLSSVVNEGDTASARA
jgi:hypothetical protein